MKLELLVGYRNIRNSKNINYNYNIDGIRADKTVYGCETHFHIHSNEQVLLAKSEI